MRLNASFSGGNIGPRLQEDSPNAQFTLASQERVDRLGRGASLPLDDLSVRRNPSGGCLDVKVPVPGDSK